MPKKQEYSNRRISIIIVAIIVSIILYLAGVFSGLYANNILKKETEKEINMLQNYVNFLDINLKNMQLEEGFMATLGEEQMCNYSIIAFNNIFDQISYYWDKLPYRLEEYEKNRTLSPDYLMLKKQYTDLSIRMWLLAKSRYTKCNASLVQGIYFYSSDCNNCIEQGEQLDELRRLVLKSNSDIIIIPIDYKINEPIINNIKSYYRIYSTPAIVINDKVLQGRVYTANELFENSLKNRQKND
ncbi:MAG: hypothetical protein QXG00_00110 [Candidatus Woesearchaeota archaeon]